MYNHNLIEKKWQKYWDDNQTNMFVDDVKKPKYYVLDMFPYPSGQGLHVGHPKGYTATDVIARYKILKGFSVLHPIGWDAFGLPAEQYALTTNNHPKSFTVENINKFRKQIKALGFNFDYSKEVDTTDPKYYKWTQWIFTKLFENDLAEIKDVDVNWCQELGTVLSNEEVLNEDGKMVSERGGFPVIKKPMRQWVLKITKYADRLISDLDLIDWPSSLKSIQKKWIGRSVGTQVKFKTTTNIELEVFTTRVDTIYGISFLAIAPEHPLINSLINNNTKKQCLKYIEIAKTKTQLERKVEVKNQTGVFTGAYALNPLTNEQVPIYIADYVLMEYATGIVMAVPAHDERDFSFAKKYNLPITYVLETTSHDAAFIGDAIHINSPLINGKKIDESKKILNKHLVSQNLATEKVTYKLKDWLFSRQRYWGEPFPIIYDKNNKPHLVTDLPIMLPDTNNFKPSADGKAPLSHLTEWLKVTSNGKEYIRETNTMPQWAGSCWYYLGYILKNPDGSYLPLDSKEAFERFERWLPVDLYIGGQEHAVLHLLYARFWHKFLFDIKVVPTPEPFYKIVNQGMILGNNGEKMSKSKGNVINPDDIVKSHGADALRIYEMFMGPLQASLSWTDDGLDGIRKWLDRIYRFFETNYKRFGNTNDNELEISYHKMVRNITMYLEKNSFNVAISEMMIFLNACYMAKNHDIKTMLGFLTILSCFAPHLAEELNSMIGNNVSICLGNWPNHDENKLITTMVTIPIMVNGKLRSTIKIKTNTSQEDIWIKVRKDPKIIQYLNNVEPKIIYVMNKVLNLVI